MAGIDPALLQAQWLQYQQGQLAQSAIIPQYQHQQSQLQGEVVGADTIAAMSDFIDKANTASLAAAQYIEYLRNELAIVDRGYLDAVQFSGFQDQLIEKFLFDPAFVLEYIKGAWTGNINDLTMSRLAETYLEIASKSPRGIAAESAPKDPRYTGNPNPQFTAQVIPQNPQSQNLIPPLPSSNGSASPYITMEQYLVAQQQGQLAQARAAALNNPAGLYGALFQ